MSTKVFEQLNKYSVSGVDQVSCTFSESLTELQLYQCSSCIYITFTLHLNLSLVFSVLGSFVPVCIETYFSAVFDN